MIISTTIVSILQKFIEIFVREIQLQIKRVCKRILTFFYIWPRNRVMMEIAVTSSLLVDLLMLTAFNTAGCTNIYHLCKVEDTLSAHWCCLFLWQWFLCSAPPVFCRAAWWGGSGWSRGWSRCSLPHQPAIIELSGPIIWSIKPLMTCSWKTG